MRILVASRGIDNIAGGVERMSAALMNEMRARGHDVALLTWDRPGAHSFFPLDPRIAWHQEGLSDFLTKAGTATRLRRARRVRAIVRAFHPDVIVGFQDGMFMAMRLYTAGMGVPVVAAERNAPSRFDFIQQGRYRHFVFNMFRLASAITIQCESYRAGYPAFLRKKIVTIANPVAPATQCADPAGADSSKKILLSIGRLGYQKHMDVLVEAFAQIAATFPDWTLIIAGEGEDRAKLETQIAQSGLASRIHLPGASKDLTPLLLTSHLFCLPSRWEGFPNVLAEAMAHGLPAVGFDGCAGVRDLIQPGVTGMLAEGNGDAATLSATLAALMQAPEARACMGQAARAAVAVYAPQKVFDQWENFLKAQI